MMFTNKFATVRRRKRARRVTLADVARAGGRNVCPRCEKVLHPDARYDGKTIAVPHCVAHPPMAEWPDRNLATGACPCCGGHVGDGLKAVRILAARRLVRAEGTPNG